MGARARVCMCESAYIMNSRVDNIIKFMYFFSHIFHVARHDTAVPMWYSKMPIAENKQIHSHKLTPKTHSHSENVTMTNSKRFFFCKRYERTKRNNKKKSSSLRRVQRFIKGYDDTRYWKLCSLDYHKCFAFKSHLELSISHLWISGRLPVFARSESPHYTAVTKNKRKKTRKFSARESVGKRNERARGKKLFLVP